MKAKYLTMIIAALALSFAATSCSEDDEDDKSVDYASKVAGTYEAYSSFMFSYVTTPMYSDTNKEKVTVTKVSDETVSVTYSGDFGEITVPEVSVSTTDTGYELSTYEGEGNWAVAMSGHSSGNYDCTFKGGTINNDGSFVFEFYAEFMGGTTLIVNSAITIADVVSGTYEAYSSFMFSYVTTPMYSDTNKEKVTVTKVSDETVSVTYSGDFGEITVPEVSVSTTDTGYELGTYEGEGNWAVAMSGHSSGNYDCTFKGGTINTDGSFEFEFYASFMGGTTLIVSSSIEPTEE